MAELKDIALENDVDLENCVVFVRGNDDILAVDIANAGIRQWWYNGIYFFNFT